MLEFNMSSKEGINTETRQTSLHCVEDYRRLQDLNGRQVQESAAFNQSSKEEQLELKCRAKQQPS